METEVDEKVSVWAFFPSSQSSLGQAIFPTAMNWRRRLIKFERVIFSSARKVGDCRFVDLVCASEVANFQLEFDSNNYCWRVKKIIGLE